MKTTWFSNFLSIEETKTSTLVICLLALLIFGCVMYYRTGDFDEEIANIICILVGSIAGTNIMTTISVNKAGNTNNTLSNNQVNNTNDWV